MEINIELLLGRPEITWKRDNIHDQIYNRRILVTGAAGSIGRELIRQIILHNPSHLCLLDQSELGIHDLKSLYNDCAGIGFELANITDARRMAFIFQECRPQVVFHTAAYKHVSVMESFPYEAIKNNVFGTQIIADLSITHQVEKFVFVSTDKAVRPSGIMGITKRLAELYLQSLNAGSKAVTQFIITRFGNVLGSTGSVYLIFKDQIQNGGPVTVTDPEASRYFMTLSEASQLILEAAAVGKSGEVFVFDMGNPVLILDIAKRMIESTDQGFGKKIEIEFIGLSNGEKLHEDLLNNEEIIRATGEPCISTIYQNTVYMAGIKTKLLILRKALKTKKPDELICILKEIVIQKAVQPVSSDVLFAYSAI